MLRAGTRAFYTSEGQIGGIRVAAQNSQRAGFASAARRPDALARSGFGLGGAGGSGGGVGRGLFAMRCGRFRI